MEVEVPQQYDWANEAFFALSNTHSSMKWQPAPLSAYTIPPSLLSHTAIERHGQVTPPDLSPTEPARDDRENSISVEQLRNEPLWPQEEQAHQSKSPSQEPAPTKRRRTRQPAPSQKQSDATPPHQEGATQPPKRKRGRPKAQPQMVQAFTADGFPFEVSSARQCHLEKNRVAAHKCRQRKKEYINSLESRAREYSSKNKALKANVAMLREDVLSLKNEVLRHAGCGFWAVDEYLARCAGDLLGMEIPADSQRPSVSDESKVPLNMHSRQNSMYSAEDYESPHSNANDDAFSGLELLKDLQDEDMCDED